jgi:hypothetical protein
VIFKIEVLKVTGLLRRRSTSKQKPNKAQRSSP